MTERAEPCGGSLRPKERAEPFLPRGGGASQERGLRGRARDTQPRGPGTPNNRATGLPATLLPGRGRLAGNSSGCLPRGCPARGPRRGCGAGSLRTFAGAQSLPGLEGWCRGLRREMKSCPGRFFASRCSRAPHVLARLTTGDPRGDHTLAWENQGPPSGGQGRWCSAAVRLAHR